MWIIIIILIVTVFFTIIHLLDKKVQKVKQENESTNNLEKDTITFDIAGVKHRSESAIKLVSNLKVGEKLKLEYEPDNKYDREAIKILTLDNIFIGYVPRILCFDVKGFVYKHPEYNLIVKHVFSCINIEDGAMVSVILKPGEEDSK